MDLFRSLQLLALRDVACKPTPEFKWRQICRYYSKNFHTPLDRVYELDPFDVAQAVYEDSYEEMELNDRLEVILQAIKTDDQIKEEELHQAEDSLDTDKFAQQVEAEATVAKKRQEDKAKKEREAKLKAAANVKQSTEKLLKEMGVFEEVMKKPVVKRKPADMDNFSLSFTGLDNDLDLVGI